MASVKMLWRRITASPATLILFALSVLLLIWAFEMIHRSVTQQDDYSRLLARLEERENNAHARALDSLIVSSGCEAIQPVKYEDKDLHHLRPYRAFSMDPVIGHIKEEMDFARVLLTYGKATLKVLSKKTIPRKLGITSEAYVPNVVHYLWPSNKYFAFSHYLSLRSVEDTLAPQYIVVHGTVVPEGTWWDQAIKDVANIMFMRKELPKKLGDINVHDELIQQSIAKTEIVLDYGGILVDRDVFVLKPLDKYRQHSLVLGREGPDSLSMGLMLGERGSPFLRLLLETYHSALIQGKTAEQILTLPHMLSDMYPNLVHVEARVFGQRPDNLPVLLSIHEDWHQFTAIRFLDSDRHLPQQPEQIKLLDSTVGEIMRHVYHGDHLIKSHH